MTDARLVVHDQAAEARDARQALGRVLASETFSSSARLAAFLRFACEEALDGRSADLNEGTIARQVFGRPEHFNAGEDSIVRSSARLLRQRLDRYYQGEGVNDPIRIVLPRGSYVPVFAPFGRGLASREDPAANPVGDPRGAAQLLAGSRSVDKRRLVLLGGAAVGLSALGAGAAWWPSARRDASPMGRVWDLLLSGPRRLLIVPADSALVMWQNQQARLLSLEEYVALVRNAAATPGSSAAGSPPEAALQGHRYTGVVSVRLAVELTRLVGSSAGLIGMRYARDLNINELKESNAVIVGAAHANPWAGLFANRCTHWIDWRPGAGFSLITRKPGADQNPAQQSANLSGDLAFAHVALKRNLGGRGHVLLICGTGSQGTDGGIDFLLDAQGLGQTLAAAGAGPGLDEFEVLVRCRIRGGQNAGYDVVAAQVSMA